MAKLFSSANIKKMVAGLLMLAFFVGVCNVAYNLEYIKYFIAGGTVKPVHKYGFEWYYNLRSAAVNAQRSEREILAVFWSSKRAKNDFFIRYCLQQKAFAAVSNNYVLLWCDANNGKKSHRKEAADLAAKYGVNADVITLAVIDPKPDSLKIVRKAVYHNTLVASTLKLIAGKDFVPLKPKNVEAIEWTPPEAMLHVWFGLAEKVKDKAQEAAATAGK